MRGTHAQRDYRGIANDLIGVNKIRYPNVVHDRQFEKRETIATFKLTVAASRWGKGTRNDSAFAAVNRHR